MQVFYQLMKNMRLRFLQYGLICMLGFFGSATNVFAVAAKTELINTAVQLAEVLQLAQHETWLALLHYKVEIVSRRHISQADDKAFFLHENGSRDPHAELLSNIEAFLRAPKQGHAQCLFPARWWWLKQQLAIPDDFDVSCPKLDVFMKRVSHHQLFLVFPSMYLNNPGSTFGHTFLRFDGEDESILLSQTLNYAARVDGSDNFFSYISKGLFGGYRGFFRARPYYETVQEYNNIENRDIWEYRLNFSPEEIKQLVRHIWEVKGIDFDYYFFRENCAYRLLALLDVIRPGLQLTGKNDFPLYAIPVDTVRALDEQNLISTRTFRASLVTQIDDYFQSQNNTSSALVLKIIAVGSAGDTQSDSSDDKQAINQLLQVVDSDAKKIEVLEQSYKILQFQGVSNTPKAQLILQLTHALSSSASLNKTANAVNRISPEKGHNSLRVAAGYGEQNSRQYIDLRFRPAFHDLLDAPQGYVDGAAINIFELRMKWFESNKLRLESLSLFNVTSISPLQRWRKPLSWMFDFRFDRAQISAVDSVRNFVSRGGVGVSLRQQALTGFVLTVGEWQLSSDYDKGYSILLGLQFGLRYNIKSSQLMMRYEINNAVAGFDLDKKITLLQWQYNIVVNHAMRAEYRQTEYDFYTDEDWSINYNYYF